MVIEKRATLEVEQRLDQGSPSGLRVHMNSKYRYTPTIVTVRAFSCYEKDP